MPVARLIASTLICCLLSAPAQAAGSETAEFPGEKLWSDTETITLRGRLSKPPGDGPFPAIVLLPNCGGPKTIEFAKFWPKYLNELGYVTLNVDIFTPRNSKKCTKSFKPNLKTVTQDAYGALRFMGDLPYVDKTRVGVLGSSLGALAISWFVGKGKSTADGLVFGAAVSLYPPTCKKVSSNAGMVPTIIILGDQEKGAASCKTLAQTQQLIVNVLPGIHHGFDKPRATPLKSGRLREDNYGNKLLYDRSATQRAQSLVKAFLAVNLATGTVPVN